MDIRTRHASFGVNGAACTGSTKNAMKQTIQMFLRDVHTSKDDNEAKKLVIGHMILSEAILTVHRTHMGTTFKGKKHLVRKVL